MFRFLFVSILISGCASHTGKILNYAIEGYLDEKVRMPLEKSINTIHHHVLANRQSIERIEYHLETRKLETRKKEKYSSTFVEDEEPRHN